MPSIYGSSHDFRMMCLNIIPNYIDDVIDTIIELNEQFLERFDGFIACCCLRATYCLLHVV